MLKYFNCLPASDIQVEWAMSLPNSLHGNVWTTSSKCPRQLMFLFRKYRRSYVKSNSHFLMIKIHVWLNFLIDLSSVDMWLLHLFHWIDTLSHPRVYFAAGVIRSSDSQSAAASGFFSHSTGFSFCKNAKSFCQLLAAAVVAISCRLCSLRLRIFVRSRDFE